MASDPSLDDYLSPHYIHKSNWLRAAVLGANDGLLSTASIAIGVASASTSRTSIILAAVAGLVAGAASMAAGEYVSVSSQTDIEKADIDREARELQDMPEQELQFLAKIYEKRGLSPSTAMQVAKELTQHDALAAHVRDELGITETSQANPLQAALASGASFTCGALLPLGVTVVMPIKGMIWYQYGFTIFFLLLLGAIAAKAGGSSVIKGSARIALWGTLAMLLTAAVGRFFGVML